MFVRTKPYVVRMTTATVGNTTEAAVLNAFAERGFNVLIPFGGGQPFDLAVQLDLTTFLRVQCKTARRRGGCIQFNSRTTDHGRGRLPYDGLADVFAAFTPWDRAIYLVPVLDISTFVLSLRTDPPRNNQLRRVRFAADFAIDRWSTASLLEITARQPPAQRILQAA